MRDTITSEENARIRKACAEIYPQVKAFFDLKAKYDILPYSEKNEPLIREIWDREIRLVRDPLLEQVLGVFTLCDGVPLVSISAKDLIVFGGKGACDGWPLVWRVAESVGIYYGCGNGPQAQIRAIGSSPDVYGCYDIRARPFRKVFRAIDLMEMCRDNINKPFDPSAMTIEEYANRGVWNAERDRKW